MKNPTMTARHALKTLNLLEATYPEAHCALVHDNPWQLLVATILSAQCTDVRVNQVTPELFRRYPDVRSMAAAEQRELEDLVRSTGFYRNKAKSLIGCAVALVRCYDGEVPEEMSALVSLPGVGRKTANVILGNAFGLPGMVVDTHVGRIARRLGWTRAKDAEKIERDLCELLPAERWSQAAHVLIFHGRQCCRAQTAWCSRCAVVERCPQVGVGRQK
jgi:endonuclease III